jgi:hypothetical protein
LSGRNGIRKQNCAEQETKEAIRSRRLVTGSQCKFHHDKEKFIEFFWQELEFCKKGFREIGIFQESSKAAWPKSSDAGSCQWNSGGPGQERFVYRFPERQVGRRYHYRHAQVPSVAWPER